MRDRDVREQTPIQSGTSKGGLLGKLGPSSPSLSVLGCGRETRGRKKREKKGSVQYCSQTSPCHKCIISVFATRASDRQYGSVQYGWVKRSITSLWQPSHSYGVNNVKRKENIKRSCVSQVKGMASGSQLYCRASQTQKHQTDMNQSVKVTGGPQRRNVSDILVQMK